MIVLFRGTQDNKHMSSEVLAIYAAINALRYSRRTLVLQFITQSPVENILVGKVENETTIKGGFQYQTDGMDALMRKMEEKKFDEETFAVTSRSMLKTEYMLDVVPVSQKKEFELEILTQEKKIRRIIKEAKAFYDDIYLLGNGSIPEQMDLLNMFADISIICIGQGSKEIIPEIETAKNRHLILVTEYDRQSSYDVGKIKKMYGEKQLAILPYNTAFKDAFNSYAVLQFALKNSNVTENDINYDFFSKIYDVEKQIMNNEVPPEENFKYKKLEAPKKAKEEEETRELKELTEKNVRYTKSYKKFLFWKKEVNGFEVDLGEFEDEKDKDAKDERDYETNEAEIDEDDIEEISADEFDEEFDAESDEDSDDGIEESEEDTEEMTDLEDGDENSDDDAAADDEDEKEMEETAGSDFDIEF